jgi:ribosome biogenesis GTPase
VPSARDVRRLDEDDVRVRPGRRGTRPRSKQRPAHQDAASGMVVAVDRGRYTVLVDERMITAMRARELGRKGIVVGDQVEVVGDLSGAPDSLARVVRVAERDTVLRRTADDQDDAERVIVANADQLVIVAALADPPPSYGLIDRCLVAALTAGIEPLLCLTKSDLAPPDEAVQRYEALSVPALVTHRGAPLEELRERLAAHRSVFVGHSGVGKSTLINALVPDADRATGAVSAIGKGRHTSSSAVALRLPGRDGGWVIDTPGVRSFGLAHVTADDLLWAFPDLEDGAVRCPPGCEHLSAAAGCTLDDWIGAGNGSQERLAAFRRLLESRATVSR